MRIFSAAIDSLASSKSCIASAIRGRIAFLYQTDTAAVQPAAPVQPPVVESHAREFVRLEAQNRADDRDSIAVDMSVTASPTNPPVIMGTTNLPDGTALMGDPPACVPRCGFIGYTTVQNGRFTIGTELTGKQKLFADSLHRRHRNYYLRSA